jgi:hypothetical protein
MIPTLLTGEWQPQFAHFLEDCAAVGVRNVATVRQLALQTIAYLRSSGQGRLATEPGQRLQAQWYASLRQGSPCWAVYDADYYLAELWACWVVYSRKYLAQLLPPKLCPPAGIAAHLAPVTRVVDLGCGIGYTTAALRQLWPRCDLWATNFPGLTQTRVAERMGRQFGFQVVPEIPLLPSPVDVIFASEYFEHIPAPVDHLITLLTQCQPRALLIANTFTAPSIGHFETYEVGGTHVPGASASRAFNSCLRQHGYVKIATKCWNQRPAYWRKASTA